MSSRPRRLSSESFLVWRFKSCVFLFIFLVVAFIDSSGFSFLLFLIWLCFLIISFCKFPNQVTRRYGIYSLHCQGMLPPPLPQSYFSVASGNSFMNVFPFWDEIDSIVVVISSYTNSVSIKSEAPATKSPWLLILLRPNSPSFPNQPFVRVEDESGTNIQKLPASKRFLFYCNNGLILLGVGLSICQQYVTIVLLVSVVKGRDWVL